MLNRMLRRYRLPEAYVHVLASCVLSDFVSSLPYTVLYNTRLPNNVHEESANPSMPIAAAVQPVNGFLQESGRC